MDQVRNFWTTDGTMSPYFGVGFFENRLMALVCIGDARVRLQGAQRSDGPFVPGCVQLNGLPVVTAWWR